MILLGGLLSVTAGAAVGSYVGTAALRATRGEAATLGRSRCDGCRRTLRAWETVPLVSYAIARGACRTCRQPIALLHPAAELTGVAVGLSLWFVSPWPAGVLMAAMAAALLAASVVDVRRLKLPDNLTAIVAVCAAGMAWGRGPEAMIEGVVAAVVTVGLLVGLRWVFAQSGGDPGLGLGDVKLIAALALWLGALTAWMVAAAALMGLALMVVRRPRRAKLAFGPMLAISGWACGFGLEAGLWPG